MWVFLSYVKQKANVFILIRTNILDCNCYEVKKAYMVDQIDPGPQKSVPWAG